MAEVVGVDSAEVRVVIAVAQRIQITAHQSLSCDSGASSSSNVFHSKLSSVVGHLTQARLSVGAERIVESSPQAPTGVTRLSLVQNDIATAETRTLNLDVQLIFVLGGDLK